MALVHDPATCPCNVCSTNRAQARATQHQPPPTAPAAGGRCIQDLVIADVEARRQVGVERYGTALQPFNGRDARADAYQEVLDLAMYLRQDLDEREQVLDALRQLVESCEEQGMQVQHFREVLDAALASRGGGDGVYRPRS